MLLFPACIFLVTWLRPLIGIPSAAALLAALIFYARSGKSKRPAPISSVFSGEEDTLSVSVWMLFAVIACSILWTFFSGIGGYFYQNEDHYGRNAIFHDILNHSWPVYFENTSSALTYYISFWLLPSLLAKGLAALLGTGVLWSTANALLFVQTVLFLTLTFLLMLSVCRVRSLPVACAALLVFVLFSGMDGLVAPYTLRMETDQIEWWAQCYQYSSNTTVLFWVYNQGVPAWLAIMTLLSCPQDIGSFALIGLAALPFSPLPFVGLFVCFIAFALVLLVRSVRESGLASGIWDTLRHSLTPQNLLACVGIIPCFLSYFAANAASSNAPFRLQLFLGAYSLRDALLRLALFCLVEFGAFALTVFSRYRKDPVFLVSVLSLLLVPLFQVGYNMDFSMRASIPGLTILCVLCIRFLLDAAQDHSRRCAACILAGLLLLGSVTPLMEFERGVYKVRRAGTIFLTADPFGTVLHPQADTDNFICSDINSSFFYTHLARKGE